ncbi:MULTISPECIES: hypothetical protein [Rhodococcus]|jgi:hypothetical protein|uniref:hypothetical protein n=1 Tax=Rhodococcus TaxID=1827 RepID=UPI0014228FC2|nr:hypothetical protein [Rhodococcus opacus]NHU47071.1 hypothetical protein [Rhodococcus sp. A14]UZG59727.1 hypothetical protein ONE62_38905 [Rhodococcus opacus]
MWILWIGALLVVGGSTGLVRGCTTLARILCALAAVAFVAVLVSGVHSLPGFLAFAAAVSVTGGLVAVTAPRSERRNAERHTD